MYVEKGVGNFGRLHLSILLLHLPMLFDLSKYTEFGELKNGEYF